MNKPLIAAASTIAIAALTSSAQAGHHFSIGFGALHAMHQARIHFALRHCERHRRIVVREEPVYVIKHRKHIPVGATTEDPAPAPVPVADNENSSISVASLDPAAVQQGANAATTDTPVTQTTADASTQTPAATDTPASTGTPVTADNMAPQTTPAPADAIGPANAQAPVKQDQPKKVANAQASDCKAFFPTVGLTLSVPCQK
jgi:hypothetical protein